MCSNDKIEIQQSGSAFFVSNLKHVIALRTLHRMIGNLFGALPLNIHQNDLSGLPMRLSLEEAVFLFRKNLAQIVKLEVENKVGYSKVAILEWEKFRHRLKIEQSELCHQDSILNHKLKLDSILAGQKVKAFKRTEKCDVATSSRDLKVKEPERQNMAQKVANKILSESERKEVAKIPVKLLDNEAVLVEIPISSYFDETNNKILVDHLDIEISELDELKCAIFEHLNSKGFYLTSALKFGGHFLVYDADPLCCHASFIALAVLDYGKMSRLEKLAYCRMAGRVNKAFMFCYRKNKTIVLDILRWKKATFENIDDSVS